MKSKLANKILKETSDSTKKQVSEYAEKIMKNENTFNWDDFLNKDDITQPEWEKVSEMAARWPTCAVGDQCKDIPRDFDGMPLDPRLRNLGIKFYGDILNQNKNTAKESLIRIEYMAAQIINNLI
jgi:hypothetical protein